MKKLLFVLLILSGFMVKAQTPIVLMPDDLGIPVQTYDLRIDTATLPAIIPGIAGANQTWNFMTLHLHLDSTMLHLENASAGVMHSFFPLANVAYHIDTLLDYNYYKSGNAGLLHYGIVSDYLSSGDSIKVVLNQPDTIVALPGFYGDSTISIVRGDSKSRCHYGLDTMIGPVPVTVPIDSVRIKHRAIHYAKFDAWGTLTTPTDITPVLRQKNFVVNLDTIWAYFNCDAFPAPYDTNTGWHLTSVLTDTTLHYTWWMKWLGVPLVKMYMHNLSGNVIDKVEWVRNAHSGITENPPTVPGLYPNPASDFIKITNTAQYTEAVVYDALGKEVNRMAIGNRNEISIPVSRLSNGLYFYNLTGKSTKTSGKFVVKH